jgi:hypothetical protein
MRFVRLSQCKRNRASGVRVAGANAHVIEQTVLYACWLFAVRRRLAGIGECKISVRCTA